MLTNSKNHHCQSLILEGVVLRGVDHYSTPTKHNHTDTGRILAICADGYLCTQGSDD